MSQLFHSSAHEAEIADLVERLPRQGEENFWREQLKGVNPPMPLGNFPKRGKATQQCDFYEVYLPKAVNEALERLTRKLELSRDTVYMAAWAYLLTRYNTEERALFGVRFVSMQSNPERLWPILLTTNQSAPVVDFLKETQRVRDGLSKREPVSERELHLWCEVPPEQILIESILDFNGTNAPYQPAQPLELQFAHNASAIVFAYWTSSFSRQSIERLAQQYLCLLEEISVRPTEAGDALNILPPDQKKQILVDWAATQRTYPKVQTVRELFEKKAAQIPDAIALEFPRQNAGVLFERQLTYHELNYRANQLARHLQKLGVGPNVVVGICAERSIEMLICVLAVLKAGGGYAPLDPTYPQDRVDFMIEDTKAPVILTQEKFSARFSASKAQVLLVDKGWGTFSHESGDNLPHAEQQNPLGYLIYTSGSTGKPKGVAMGQGPLVNLLFWQMENWSGPADARTLQFASLNFDVSFQEIFSTWCSGGTLVLIDEERRRDANALALFLNENRIQRLFLPFVALKHLAEASERERITPTHLREVITAGEQLQVTPQIINFFSRLPQCTLENQYGPSETHVVTAWRLRGGASQWPALPGIGKPIANTKALILNQRRQPVPIGVPGEIYLAGVCLAHGYLNRPEMTAEKFVENPFDPGAKMYKTGDLARWLPDGTIEFLGRIDHQVKVRGFRIELGEIETVLSKHHGVREAVVVAQETERGDKQLVAYVVSNNGTIAGSELRGYLQQHVPPYCIPAAFVNLPKLPLTPNGKVDRRALPKPSVVEEPVSQLKLPRDPLEMQLKLVFEKFLQRRPISIDLSFFEMGGDSLQALKLVVEIERATGTKLQLNILYQAPTIEALAEAIRKQGKEAEFSCLVPLQPHGKRPPLFLVHTTPGDVLGYGNLIYHLDSNQPCYGFQSRGFDRPESSHRDIREMAAHYVSLLRKQQPRGPYFLGGWCYGGIVAVEMAHQLRAAGEKVAPLLLIETPAPAPGLLNFRYYARRLGCLLSMKPQQWKNYLSAKYRYYSGRRAADEMRFRRVDKVEEQDKQVVEEQNRLLAKLEHVYHLNLCAWQNYKPSYYSGEIVLFNAAEHDPAVIPDPQYGWTSLARTIHTHCIPGDHDTILMEPHVRVLAEKINTCLLKAQQSVH